MAYKPPKQTIVDNDLKGVPSNEAVFEGLKLKLPKPSIDGTSGQLLARGASSDDTSWVNPPSSLPSSSAGDVDKVLAVDDVGTKSWRYAGLGAGSLGTSNTVLGKGKPTGLTGTNNIVIGQGTTGNGLSDKSYAILIGNNTEGSSQDSYSIRIGHGITGNFANGVTVGNNAVGNGNSVTLGNSASSNNFCVVVGHSSLSIDDNATIVGYNSLGSTRGVAVGYEASRYSLGSDNVAIGASALRGTNVTPFTSSGHVVIGSSATITGTGSNTVTIGFNASSTTGSVAVGNAAVASAAYAVAVGQQSLAPEGSVAVGHFSQCTGTYSVAVGQGSSSLGGSSVSVGYEADATTQSVTIGAVSRSGSGQDGTFVGYFSGKSSASGANNTAIGSYSAHSLSNGASNVFVGKDSGRLVESGSNNTIIGSVQGSSALSDTLILATGTTQRITHDSTQCTIKTGDLAIETVGKTLKVATGTDAAMGLAVFSGVSTVTVTTAAATGNYYVFLTAQSGTDAFHIANKTTGSFDIIHNGNVTADVAWLIVRY